MQLAEEKQKKKQLVWLGSKPAFLTALFFVPKF